MDIQLKRNKDDLQVLTPTGYQSFSYIAKIPNENNMLTIYTNDGHSVCVTDNHLFFIEGKQVQSSTLNVGDKIETINGISTVKEIEVSKEDFVYELINVGGDNTYYTNGILSHNCKFLGSSNTLIDSDILERMVSEQPVTLKYNGAFQIFEEPNYDSTYIMGVDSGKGSQSDYSVIQVLKINSEKDLEQVAVYRNNTLDIHDFSVVVDEISKYYNECQMMVESNDIGEVLCDALWNELECDRLINYDKKGLGIRSTKKTKLAGNLLLKKYIDNGWLQIKDQNTIYELSIYEEVSPNVFHAAGQNDHDDCVTSLIWAVFFLTTEFFEKDGKPHSKKVVEDERMVMYDDGFFNPTDNNIGDIRFDDNWRQSDPNNDMWF